MGVVAAVPPALPGLLALAPLEVPLLAPGATFTVTLVLLDERGGVEPLAAAPLETETPGVGRCTTVVLVLVVVVRVITRGTAVGATTTVVPAGGAGGGVTSRTMVVVEPATGVGETTTRGEISDGAKREDKRRSAQDHRGVRVLTRFGIVSHFFSFAHASSRRASQSVTAILERIQRFWMMMPGAAAGMGSSSVAFIRIHENAAPAAKESSKAILDVVRLGALVLGSMSAIGHLENV
jgi:hypothetical protein